MYKIVLKDNTTIDIHDDTGMFNLITDINDYNDLDELAKKFTRDNLSSVKIETAESDVIGMYKNLTNTSPLFQVNKDEEGHMTATFGFREMNETELKYEQLAQQITDTEIALCEVYELIGG